MPDRGPAADRPQYTERLWPGIWVWVLALGGVGALSIAYGAALGPVAALVVATVGVILMIALVIGTAARIVVSGGGLRAGRALLPWEWTGQVLALDAEQTRTARGPTGDPTAFLLTRPGVGPGAVVVEVTDPEDPHRTWLLATRHPRSLARAIGEARGTLSA